MQLLQRSDIARISGRRSGAILGLIVVVAAVLRWMFIRQMDIPVFDPWRHLQLIENLRHGLGFTLFDGQPYLWYSPVWYGLCAALPSALGVEWYAAFLSVVSVVFMYVFLLSTETHRPRQVAAAGALLMAAFGPLIAFTCHYGSEAFALSLLLGGLVLCARARGAIAGFVSGVLLGVALAARMNFAFNVILFVPFLRSTRRAAAFAGGLALPLLLTFWRNYLAIREYPYIFSWDGLATRSADYTWLSTLVVQMQASVQEGAGRLYGRIIPGPQWMDQWELILFMGVSIVCLILSRRLSLILAGSLSLAGFLVFDKSLSSNFFRISLSLFPVLFLGTAVVVGNLGRRGPIHSALGWGLVTLIVLAGAGYLTPQLMYPLEDVTPPPNLLTENAYMVTSGFYQPESLVYRFPEKHFVGMPLEVEDFEDFRRRYPEYKYVLWHDFSVQENLGRYLLESGKYRIVRAARNMYGRQYFVLAECPEAEDPRVGWGQSRPARSRH